MRAVLRRAVHAVFWMGDMNYRIELSYEETCKQVEAATTSGNWEVCPPLTLPWVVCPLLTHGSCAHS